MYGFIDRTGNEVIALKYKSAWDFKNGLARVQYHDKWGFIDKNDAAVIAFEYEFFGQFSDCTKHENFLPKYSTQPFSIQE